MAEVIVIGGDNADIKGRSLGSFIPGTSNPGNVVTSVGGVSRNIAHNLALLGVKTALVAFTGNDVNGEMIRRETKAAGVDISLLGRSLEPTGVYLAIMDGHGEPVDPSTICGPPKL